PGVQPRSPRQTTAGATESSAACSAASAPSSRCTCALSAFIFGRSSLITATGGSSASFSTRTNSPTAEPSCRSVLSPGSPVPPDVLPRRRPGPPPPGGRFAAPPAPARRKREKRQVLLSGSPVPRRHRTGRGRRGRGPPPARAEGGGEGRARDRAEDRRP